MVQKTFNNFNIFNISAISSIFFCIFNISAVWGIFDAKNYQFCNFDGFCFKITPKLQKHCDFPLLSKGALGGDSRFRALLNVLS